MQKLFWSNMNTRNELITVHSIKVKTFVEKFRIPFFIIISVLFLLEYSTALVRSVGFNSYLALAVACIYLILLFSLAIYFWIVAIKVILFMKKKAVSADVKSKVTKVLPPQNN